MSRYIDADKLTEIIKSNAYELTDKHNSYGVGMFVDGILQAMKEAEDEEPIRQGRWIDEGDGYWKCSVCNEEIVADAYGDIHPIADCGWIYCPYCGAKMDSEEK